MSLADVLAGRQGWHVEVCHVLEGLAQLPDSCVQTVVTSPPYWGLRAYGTEPVVMGGEPDCTHGWDALPYAPQRDGGHGFVDGGKAKLEAYKGTAYTAPGATCTRCGAWRGELGSEPTPALWVAHMVAICREVRRVLRDDGTVWLNIGDSYAANTGASGGNHLGTGHGRVDAAAGFGADRRACGIPAKSLCLIPERLAIALQDDGWIVRSRIAWCKLAPMPESVADRPTSAWEHVWLLTKQARYFYDAEAVRQPQTDGSLARWSNGGERRRGSKVHSSPNGWHSTEQPTGIVEGGANLRNWWPLPPAAFSDAHFATFVPELPRRCILAGTSAHGACATCGAPWRRVSDVSYIPEPASAKMQNKTILGERTGGDVEKGRIRPQELPYGRASKHVNTLSWQPTCRCADPRPPVPCLVLDIFSGSGTTGLVARQLGRRYLGLELNPDYAEMSRQRIANDAPLLEMLEPPGGAVWDQLALFA